MRLFELAEDLKIKGSTKMLKEFLNAHGFGVKTDNDEVPQRGVELAMKEMPAKLAAVKAERQQKEKERHKRESVKRAQKRKEEAEARKQKEAEDKKRKAEAEKLAREEKKRAEEEAKRKALEEKAAAKQRAAEEKKRAAEEKKKAAEEKKKAATAKTKLMPPVPDTQPPADQAPAAQAAPEPAVAPVASPAASPAASSAAPRAAPAVARPAPPPPPPPPVGVPREAYHTRSTLRPAVPPTRALMPAVPSPAAPAGTVPAAEKPKSAPPPPPPPVGVPRKDAAAEKLDKTPAASVEKVPSDPVKKSSTLANDVETSLKEAQSHTFTTKRPRIEKEIKEDRHERKKPQFSGVENRDELINRPRLSASAALRQIIAERVAPVNVPGLRKLRKMRHSLPGARPSAPAVAGALAAPREIVITLPITVRDFSQATGIKVGEVISKLMRMNIMANINQTLDRDTIELFAADNNLPIKFDEPQQTLESSAFAEQPAQVSAETLVRRNPVVTFMGHVDHGKTSLLDAIRQTNVAAGESGGITQHIGASQVTVPSGTITFVDTPGHEAFTAMRARGARVTDIAVLVVAADDGLMPQSLEAIDHARAANVPIMVAINKIDLPGANPDRVLAQLAERGLTPEAWGGDTICCNVSAVTREGIDKLLEMICLQAEILELRARPSGPAAGVVLEAVLDPQRGPLVTLLVQQGRLQRGDAIVCGTTFARARALQNFRGEPIETAGPSDPVLVLGFDSVPAAGSAFRVATSERHARELVEERRAAEQLKRHAEAQKVSLETFYRRMANEQLKELRLIIKGDTQGTTEAVRAAVERLSSGDAKVSVLHSGVGVVTDNDVSLASASDAVILAFRVDVRESARTLAKSEGVDIKSYDVIYHATEEIQRALQGLLEPVFKEVETGVAEVRAVFKLSAGTVAGCHVISGTVQRSNRVRVLRAGQQVFEGEIQSLRHLKDEVREVRSGYDCGILLRGFSDVQEGDRIHSFKLEREAAPTA